MLIEGSLFHRRGMLFKIEVLMKRRFRMNMVQFE